MHLLVSQIFFCVSLPLENDFVEKLLELMLDYVAKKYLMSLVWVFRPD